MATPCERASMAPYNFNLSADASPEECREAMSICATGDAGFSDIWKTLQGGTVEDQVGKVRNNRTGIGTHALEKNDGTPFTSGKKYVAYTHYITDTSSYSAVAIGQKATADYTEVSSGGFSNYRLLYDDKKLIDTNVFLKNIANHKILGRGENDDIQPSVNPTPVGNPIIAAEFVSANDDVTFEVQFNYVHLNSAPDDNIDQNMQVILKAYPATLTPNETIKQINYDEFSLVDVPGGEGLLKTLAHGNGNKIEFNLPNVKSRQSKDSPKKIVEVQFNERNTQNSVTYTWEFEDLGPNEQQIQFVNFTQIKANNHAQYGINNVNIPDSVKLGEIFEDELVQAYPIQAAAHLAHDKIHLIVKQKRKLRAVEVGRDYTLATILPGKFNKPKYSAGQTMYKNDEPPKVWRNYWREVYTSTNEHSITDVAKWSTKGNLWALDYAGKENARRSIKYFVINSFDEIESAKIFSALTPETTSNSTKPALNKLSFDKFGNITIYGEKDTTPRVPKAITYKSPFGFKVFNDDKSINCPSSGPCKIDRVIFYRNPLYSKFFSDTGTIATASADRLKFDNTQEIHIYASKQSEVGNSGLEVAGNRGHSKDENIKNKYLTNTLTELGEDVQNWYTGDRDCIMQVEGKYILKRLDHYIQWRKEYLGILVSRLNKITKTVNRETNGDPKPIAEWGIEVTDANKIEYKKYYNIYHALKAKVTATTAKPTNYQSPYPNDPGAGKWDELKPDKIPLYELLYNPIHHSQFKKYYNALLIENKVLDLVDTVKNSRSKVGETRYTSNIKFDSSKTGSNETEYRDYDNVIQNYCNSMVNKDRISRKFYNPVTYAVDNETVYEKYTDYSCSLTAANLHIAYSALMGKNFTYNTLMYKKFSVNLLRDKFAQKKTSLGLLEQSQLTEAQKEEVLDDLLAEQDDQRWPNLARNNLGTLFTEGKVIVNEDAGGGGQNENTQDTVTAGDDAGEVIRGALCSKDSSEKKGYGPGFFISNFFGSETGTSDSFIQELFSAALVENKTLKSSEGRKCHIYTKGSMAKCIMQPSIYINVTCKNVVQNSGGGSLAMNNVELTNNCPLNVDLSQTTLITQVEQVTKEPPTLRIEATGPTQLFYGPTSKPYRIEANSDNSLQSVAQLPEDKKGATEINGVTVKCKNPGNVDWTDCESIEILYNGADVNGYRFTENDFLNQPAAGVEITFRAQHSDQTDLSKYGEIKKRIKLVEPLPDDTGGENCYTFDNYNCSATSEAALNNLGNMLIQEKNANGVATGRIRYERDDEKFARLDAAALALDESNTMYQMGCRVNELNAITGIRTFTETRAECEARIAQEDLEKERRRRELLRQQAILQRKIINNCKQYDNTGALTRGMKICDVEGYLTPGCMDPLYENYSPDYGEADNTLCGNISDQEFTNLNKKRVTVGGEEVLDQDELKFVFNRFNNESHSRHTTAMTYADTNNDTKLTAVEFQTYKDVLNTYGGYQVSVSEAPCGVDSVFINSFNSNSDTPITLNSNCAVVTDPTGGDDPIIPDPDPVIQQDEPIVTLTAENRYYRNYNIGQFVRCFNDRSKMCMVSEDPDNSDLKIGTNQDLETKRTCLIDNVYKYYDDLTPTEKSQCTSSLAWKDGQLVDYYNLYAQYDKANDGSIYCDADPPEGLDAVPQTDLDGCKPRPTTVCSKATCSQECLDKFIKYVEQCKNYNCAFHNTQCPEEELQVEPAIPLHIQKKQDDTIIYLMIGGGILFLIILVVTLLIIF